MNKFLASIKFDFLNPVVLMIAFVVIGCAYVITTTTLSILYKQSVKDKQEQLEREQRSAAQNYMLNNALGQCQIQLTESQKQLTYFFQMSEDFRNQCKTK